MARYQAFEFDKLADYICESYTEELEALLAETEGMSQEEVEAKFATDFSGLSYTTISEEDDTAAVEISGEAQMARGGELETVSADEVFENGQIRLVKEDGKWKMCPEN